MISLTKAPAYATIQDLGRRGFRASGVPRAGAMDSAALATLNTLLGNNCGAAGVEWALTGGQLEFGEVSTFAMGGAEASASLNGSAIEPYRAYHASSGDSLVVESLTGGRFLYVCFAGGVECDLVMKSRSTYVLAGFGGLEGRRLKTGDVLKLGNTKGRKKPQVSDQLPEELRPPLRTELIRYVARDTGDANESLSGSFSVSPASDRTGYRLTGELTMKGGSATSEPVCPGAIQLPPGGEPIVLMADAPTIGGYRIVGGVISADLGS
ncbi:MAG: biotin-dependent carboxyltransferase family protein, partial [Gemmatimonadales bacterium]